MHAYWDTQPATRTFTPDEKETLVRTDATPLPPGYEWSTCTIDETYTFLKHRYLTNETFRHVYTTETLRRCIDRTITIRSIQTKEIVGHITSVYINARVESTTMRMAQINFLCIHENHRNQRFTPCLVDEIKRRIALDGVWHAIFTAHASLPGPLVKSTFWHRFLDVKKLVRLGFHRTNRVRDKFFEVRGPCVHTWRKMVEGDIPNVIRILQDHVAQFTIAPIIDEAYIRRWVLPIHSYVDDSSGAFVSFYDIPYERVDGSGTIKQAVRFYTVGKDVFNDTFILAKNLGSDVFNTLDVGVTGNLRDYKFMEGSGYIHYHLFNYTVTSDKPVTIQMVLP